MGYEHEKALYEAWVELLSWMRAYAKEKGVRFEKEADFPDFIYRMERPYDLPTTIMTASLSDALGEP
ncbi:MAG: NADH-quinone oxidoreductase, partial [Thermus sp.]